MKKEHSSSALNTRNSAFDNTLRPGRFGEFVGQKKIRERLELAVKAASDRGETLDHVLFSMSLNTFLQHHIHIQMYISNISK